MPDDPEKPTSNGDAHSRAFDAIPVYLNELIAYAGHYVSAKLDSLKVTLRAVIATWFLVVLLLVGLSAILACAFVMLMVGLAQGLGAALGGRVWLGDLIVGGTIVVVFMTILIRGLRGIRERIRLEIVRKYEAARKQQRSRFGHDVADKAATAGRVAL